MRTLNIKIAFAFLLTFILNVALKSQSIERTDTINDSRNLPAYKYLEINMKDETLLMKGFIVKFIYVV